MSILAFVRMGLGFFRVIGFFVAIFLYN
uniref:Uncharacterized protein n=1 Tax=Rhizophora mucronata TaxID=61149 RepID=A0A2P2N937_RHIMU